jgi:signal transduction histidine kinase
MAAQWLQFGLTSFHGMQVAAFVLAVIALLNLAIWWRDGDAGLQWFGAGLLLLALWGAAHELHVTTGAHVRTDDGWRLVLHAGVAALCIGLVQYVGVPVSQRWWVYAALLAPLLLAAGVIVVTLLGEVRVTRHLPRLLLSLSFAGMAALAWWARKREPGAGHGVIAAAALAVPLLSLAVAWAGLHGASVRHLGSLAILLLALTLLTVPLLRRRRALQAEVQRRSAAEAALQQLNDSLEQQVAQRTAAQHEMIEALESFNRSVSHDLRGPLGGIAELARIAQAKLDAGDGDVTRRSLQAIAAQSDSLARTVEALLELARVSEQPMQRAPLALEPLVREAMALVEASARQPLPPVQVAPLPRVQADAALVRVALVNLIGNAVKFTRGRSDAQVAVSAHQHAAGEVTVTVSDNGPGFEPAAAQRLFEPFTRLHDGTQHEGHGIGLSIVRRAIARMGGRVWAEGRPGAGARFHFTLPAA